MANQINIQVGADIKNFQAGINQAVQTMKDAGQDMSGVSESVKRLTESNFKTISQAYRQTSKDAEILALHLGTDSDAFKQAAGMAQAYGQQLQDVRNKIAGVDMANTSNQVQKAAGSFNMLGNSVNQLTRELPAFTYSVQTGFMALSNNIPMFVDQINSIRAANAALAAEGKVVQSTFSQITSAIFSWNTALSLGITALTMFAPQISDFITKMGDANATISEAAKAQQELNKWVQEYTETEYQKAIRKENEETAVKLQQLRELVRLQSLSVEQSLVPGVSRFDVVMARKQTLENLEKAEAEHKRRLEEIDNKYNNEKKTRDIQQAQFEVSLFEDKFTKMREALRQFKEEDSYKAALELTLPTAEDINSTGGLEEIAEAIIQPFVHIRTQVNEELNKTLSDMIKWSDMAAGVMAQAGAALGQALVTGDFQSAGEAIVKQLGGIAIQIGAAMIAIGIPQAAVGLPSGFAYIAGGTALGILGGVMQASGKAPNQQGDGAGNGGYQSDYTPFNPNFAGASQYLMLDSRVRGTDIIISADNQRRQNRRIR